MRKRWYLTIIMLAIFVSSCHHGNLKSGRYISAYVDSEITDVEILAVFEKDLDRVVTEGIHSVFIDPQMRGKILFGNGKCVHVDEDPHLDVGLFGGVWLRVDFYEKHFSFTYGGYSYEIEFERGYRYVFISYDAAAASVYVENSKYPLVMYLE